jgi:RNA polymerase sigma-70 factor, ECF subfamily
MATQNVCLDSLPLDFEQGLMMRAARDDAGAFELLLARHRQPIIQFLQRMVLRFEVAEELAQEVFLRAYLARAAYEPRARFTTWVYRIATNLALNWLRDNCRDRGVESLDAMPSPERRHCLADRARSAEQQALAAARAREIRAALATLPPRQRAAVVMHKYDELEYHEIASVLGCSMQTVKSLLFRAHGTLRARLAYMA